MTRFYTVLKTPAQEIRLKVRPARNGVRLDLGDRFTYLNEKTALDLANAIVDATEHTGRTHE